jgi:hypothetical protein
MSSAVSVAAVAIAASGLMSSPAAQAAPSRGVQLTGTQILSALLPPSYFPRGYKLLKSSVISSGSRLVVSPAKYNLATMSCRTFLVNFPNHGLGATATAGDVIANRGVTQAYTQVVYQFASTGRAAAFYRAMYALYARCRSVRVTVSGSTFALTTQSLTRTRVGGHQTFYVDDTIRVSGPNKNLNGTTVNHGVFTFAGTDLFSVDALGAGPPTPPPTSPSRTAAVLRLIARVQAAR